MDYKDLEVWQLARDLSIDIHRMTLHEVPKFEMYEEGSQIRRSSKSIRANIVEGYGKRRYKMEFVRHLTYALGSARETEDHLNTLWETGSLTNEPLYKDLCARINTTIAKLVVFTRGVEQNHES
ncbi:MAG: four helix bundle protein [Verrucomicrobiaceae bacterium]